MTDRLASFDSLSLQDAEMQNSDDGVSRGPSRKRHHPTPKNSHEDTTEGEEDDEDDSSDSSASTSPEADDDDVRPGSGTFNLHGEVWDERSKDSLEQLQKAHILPNGLPDWKKIGSKLGRTAGACRSQSRLIGVKQGKEDGAGLFGVQENHEIEQANDEGRAHSQTPDGDAIFADAEVQQTPHIPTPSPIPSGQPLVATPAAPASTPVSTTPPPIPSSHSHPSPTSRHESFETKLKYEEEEPDLAIDRKALLGFDEGFVVLDKAAVDALDESNNLLERQFKAQKRKIYLAEACMRLTMPSVKREVKSEVKDDPEEDDLPPRKKSKGKGRASDVIDLTLSSDDES
ncbi:hypothetical protein RQP46_001375 [Phenoliferia psychrophenolica]